MKITVNLILGLALLVFNAAMIGWLIQVWDGLVSGFSIFIFIMTVPYMIIFLINRNENGFALAEIGGKWDY